MRLDGDDFEDGKFLDELLGFLLDEHALRHVPAGALQVQPTDETSWNDIYYWSCDRLMEYYLEIGITIFIKVNAVILL